MRTDLSDIELARQLCFALFNELSENKARGKEIVFLHKDKQILLDGKLLQLSTETAQAIYCVLALSGELHEFSRPVDGGEMVYSITVPRTKVQQTVYVSEEFLGELRRTRPVRMLLLACFQIKALFRWSFTRRWAE